MPDGDITIAVTVEVPEDTVKQVPAFRDTLHIPKAEYDGLSKAEINRRKKERYDGFVATVKAPPPPVIPPEVTPDSTRQEILDRITMAQGELNAALNALLAFATETTTRRKPK